MEAQTPRPFRSPVPSPGLLVPNNSPSYSFPAGERAHPQVLNRGLEATISNTTQQTNTSGFVRPQQVTTRLRRSAGFPSLRPNRPRNNSQSHIDEMNNPFLSGQSYERSLENGSNYQGIWIQQPGYGQSHDYDQQRTYSQQASSHNQITYGPQINYSQESAVVSSLPLLKEWISDPKIGRRTCTSATAALFPSSSDFHSDRIIVPCSSCIDNRAARPEPETYRPLEDFSK
jgi:hypothetical protein